MDRYAIGNNINALLRERRMKQKELAALIGVTEPTMSNWITGIRQPTCYGLFRISKVLGVTMEELMKGIEG